MSTIRCLTCAVALSLPILAAGCGKPAMVPVRGTILYRGYPVNNGLLVLTPEEKGPLAIGRINTDGNVILYTGDNPGAYPGTYKITISSLAPSSSTMENGGRFEFPRSALPEQYREHDPSRKRFVVAANRPNNLDLDLGD